MSERSPPLQDRPHRLSLRGTAIQLAASLVVTVAIIATALGEAGRNGMLHMAALSGLPHLPRLAVLAEASPAVKIHLLAVLLALGLGTVLLAGVKGTRMHRLLGWGWVALMTTGAIASLFIRIVNHGSLSFLHLLSGWTLIVMPLAILAVRRGRVRQHARAMTGLFIGGLIVAGLFAFMPGRLMWAMIFG